MRDLRDIRGLKYPDEYVVRWFFKQALHQRPGRLLELGSGVGNNLALPVAYGWNVDGVDLSQAALDDARHNLGPEAGLIHADLSRGLPDAALGPYDAVMVPNLLCYLTLGQAETVLDQLKPRLKRGADIFLRTRLPDDHRCGRGAEIDVRTWRLDTPETGEQGLINRFYDEAELVELLTERLGLTGAVALKVKFDNPQGGMIVTNSDLVVWGRAG
ncbi:MAG: class I SAM-dependent methyltransferase [Proteobacteria bacterium]|nr:class I SAM-dependent methyltransferase [Pseudomonadota bacterium]